MTVGPLDLYTKCADYYQRIVAKDNRVFREAYLQENASKWPYPFSIEEFDSLDPLAREPRLVGSPTSPGRSPVLSVGGDIEMTPPTSPELVHSDTEMSESLT